jgi:GNAT superfamily N-acetyltransferase
VFDLWIAEHGGQPGGAAVRTAPYKMVLAEPAEAEAIDAICDAVLAAEPDVPGVVANLPWARRFVDRWRAATGTRAELVLSQGVFALTQVRDPRPAPGAHRSCGPEDRGLLRRWIEEFQTEALSHQPYDPERTERMLDVRLSDGDADGLWFWERDGEPVSLAGFGGAGLAGTRVGPVYTPREHRGRGFASNLVAELSRWVLTLGSSACYLYTDLSNPTSNGIYVAVGYEQVAESAEYTFVST